MTSRNTRRARPQGRRGLAAHTSNASTLASVSRAIAAVVTEQLEGRTLLSGTDHTALPWVQPPQTSIWNPTGLISKKARGSSLTVAQGFLSQNASQLGLTSPDLASTIVTDQYTDADTLITHIYLRQQANGLDVVNANLVINLLKDGRIINVAGGLVSGLSTLASSVPALAPAASAVDALRNAASALDLTFSGSPTDISGVGENAPSAAERTLSAPGISNKAVPAVQQYVWTPDGLRLTWNLEIDTADKQHWYSANIDVETGELLLAADYVSHASYNVLPLPNDSPLEGSRSILTDPHDTTVSPYGWHDTNGVAGAEYTITRGNNAYAYTDTSATNTPGLSPDGGSSLNFNYTWDTSVSPTSGTNPSAAVTNLFYVNNLLHDIHARYGFTEAAGNFQVKNYSNTGTGNDPVLAEAIDGSGTNNANMATPAEGSSPRMQMYQFTYTSPSRDGDFENGIVTHEYGHGVSNRLTGGPSNASALTAQQSGGMGEGWSDFWALMLTQRASDTQNQAYPMGPWVLGQPATGAGIRRYPYSFDMTKNPQTFANYASSTEVHDAGELWCDALWDMNWLLIQKYGFSANVAGGYDPNTSGLNAGNQLTLRLVMDALKLQPANPSFIDARNAIIAADNALTGGKNLYQIWSAFARRGLGASASTTSSSSSVVTTSFALPTALQKPSVLSQSPVTPKTTPVSYVEVNFSESMLPSSFSIADDIASFTGPGNVDLLSSITSTTWSSLDQTLRINFATQSTNGNYKLVLNPSILSADDSSGMDQDHDGVTGEAVDDQYTISFGYDALQLQVASTTPASGSLVSLPFTTLDVSFNEAFDPATLAASDLTISQGTVTAATALNATTARFTLSGITAEGNLSANIAADAIRDASGFGMAAFSGTYATDIGTVAMPAFVAALPAGSLVYRTSTTGILGTTGDEDRFSVTLDADQLLSIAVTGASTLQPRVRVLDASNNVLGTATSTAVGKAVVLQNVAITSGGVYTIVVDGNGTTAGAFTVRATLNAAMEAETYDGPTNDTLAGAQSIDNSFEPLGGGASRGAVVGNLPGATGVPFKTESYPTGTLSGAWSTYSDNSYGRIRVLNTYVTDTSSYGLFMDANVDSNYALNEAIWTVDLSGLTAASLSFSQTNFSDEQEILPTTFSGHYNGDGIAISGDGVNWRTLWQATNDAGNPTWNNVTVDLAAAAAAAGITLGPGFQIKFQQYDNFMISTDGRGWDNIVISTPAAAVDWYSVTLAANQATTFATKSATTIAPLLSLYDSTGTLVASGVSGATNVDRAIAAYTPATGGVYYLKVEGASGGDYTLLATRAAAFSLAPHVTRATAQSLDGRRAALGAIGPAATTSSVVPSANTAAEANSGNSYPFDLAGTRYQQIYSASATPAGSINAIRFRRNSSTTSAVGSYDIEVRLAYAATTVSTASGVFATNIGASETVVYNGIFAPNSSGSTFPAPFDVVIPLSTSFNYNPALGDLLMEIRTRTNISGGYAYLDAAGTGSQTTTQRIWSTNGINATSGTLGLSGDSYLYGLVTRFDYASTAATQEWYSVPVNAGSSIAFNTITPGDGAGEFVNTLDPHLELYDPSGSLVVSGIPLGDGRNESISALATVSGTYSIRVSSDASSIGEYILRLGEGLSLSLPTSITEGITASATLTASSAPATDLNITLSSSNPARLGVPTTVTLPAGQTSISIPLTALDDSLLNGPESVQVLASATGYFAGSGGLNVVDNESATLTVSLPTSSTTEGAGALSGSVSVSAAPTRDIVVSLVSSVPGRLSVPATVTILAGQTSATFVATPSENTAIDGTATATITASFPNWVSGTASISVADNDATMTISIPAGDLWEGRTYTGSVLIGGTLTSPLTVSLASGDTTEMTLPASVTIPAGQTSATFVMTMVADTLSDGAQRPSITLTASGLPTVNTLITVHDANITRYAFDAISATRTAGVAASTTARAYNVDNEVVAVYAGTASLTATKQSGASIAVTPATATFTAGVWTGNVVLTTADPAVTLALSANGITGTSLPFAVQANTISGLSWSTISSPAISGVPFTATVTAQDAYGNTASSFNGTTNLSGLVGTSVSSTILASPTYQSSYSGNWTLGYLFTPNTNVEVTHVRSYWGSKVCIWNNSGTLLASQNVNGTPAVWTETALATPVTLQAGVTYRISAYSNNGTYYYRTTAHTNPTFGTIGASVEGSGDAYPSGTSTSYWMVDLRGNVGSYTSIPVTPSSATFVNGVWTGQVTVTQSTTGMRLRASSGTVTGDSNVFDVITQNLTLGLPTDVGERDGNIDVQLSLWPAPASDLVVTLTSSNPGRFNVPATIVVPAGQTSVTFTATILDNALFDGNQSVTVTASATAYQSSVATVVVHDDDTGAISLSLPTQIQEGASAAIGTVNLSSPATSDLVVRLSANGSTRLSVPATVTVPAGQTSADFNITAVDNAVIDGTAFVSIGATMEGWLSGYKTIRVLDNDATLSFTLPSGTFWEGQAISGTVRIGGTLTSPLTVNLSSSDTTGLTVPTSVTIAAGQTSATFAMTLPADALKDGLLNVTLGATAPQLTSGSTTLAIHDANVDRLGYEPISGTITAGTPFATIVRAYNISNEVVTPFSGAGTLTATNAAGSVPVTGTVTFASGVANSSVTLTRTDPATVLHVTSSAVPTASTADSVSLIVNHAAASVYTFSNITGPQLAGVPFAASINVFDAYGNAATTFNGSLSLTPLRTTTTNATMWGSNTYTSSTTTTGYTYGFDFTPNATFTATHFRTYWGTKVSLWNASGTLLASTALAGTAGAWVETPLTIPVTLTAGSTYRIGTYNSGAVSSAMYYRSSAPTNPAFGAFGNSYYQSYDAQPIYATSSYALADLRGDYTALGPVAGSPATATFVNGVWTGNVTVNQPNTGVRLRVTDASNRTSDSSSFDVLAATVNVDVPTQAGETDGLVTGTVSIPQTLTASTTITLTSGSPTRVSVPASVVIPAGQTSATFPITILDNALLDGAEAVAINATIGTNTPAAKSITVIDDESADVSVNLPASVNESAGTVSGTIVSSVAPTRDVVISLVSGLSSRVTVPATVTLRAGQTTASFTATVINDLKRNGNGLATILATVTNWASTPATLAVVDDDAALTLTLPASGERWENRTVTNGGVVRIGGGPLDAPLVVTLTSSDTSEMVLPTTVTIPAGQNEARFDVTFVADGIVDGLQMVNASASSSAIGSVSIAPASADINVHDADLHHFTVTTPTAVTNSQPFTLNVQARNVDGETLPDYAGAATLTATSQSGATLPVTPTSLTFSHGIFNATDATIVGLDPAATLTVNAGAIVSTSTPFAITGLRTPTGVDLVAESDTGASTSDDITSRNNATGRTLKFLVTGTDAGATVTIWADGVAIGSAVASGDTTVVETNGTVTLADGVRAVTATQAAAGQSDSAATPTLLVTVDASGPTMTQSPFFDPTVSPRVTIGLSDGLPASLPGDTFSLINLADPLTPITVTVVATPQGVQLMLGDGSLLQDGWYRLSVKEAAFIDAAGNTMGAGTVTYDFFSLAGDLNRDGSVNFDDLLALSQNYGTASGATLATGDTDHNGTVDFDDLLILAQRYGTTLPGAPSTFASAVAAQPATTPRKKATKKA